MSIKNILFLTLLISQLRIHNFIQAEIIHGVDVPILDGSKIVGKWYELTSCNENDSFTCTINVIERLSADQYRMNATMTLTPEAKRRLSLMSKSAMEFSAIFTLQNDSAVLVSRYGNATSRKAVIFDFDPNSHLVMYVTAEKEITNTTLGLIYIFGRGKELPPGIIEKTEQSNFYKNGVHSNFKFYPANTYGCIE